MAIFRTMRFFAAAAALTATLAAAFAFAPTALAETKRLFVGNLAWITTDEDLLPLFEQYGPVASIRIVTDRETGRSRGFGFVDMIEGGDDAIAALNGTSVHGSAIQVGEARERGGRQ